MTDQPTYSTLFSSGVQPPGSQPDSLGSLRQLGQYRIVKQLGRGGMGVVYQAEDTHLNRLAALKVMRADHAADSGARARFIREAQAAARLKHDHIVTIYQVGEENDVPFLAMEFLTGKSLEDWLRPDRRATVMEALLIGKQVARGLSAAHAANLIHRDIKPANLWLEAPRGRVKILDFGLARYSGADYPALTQDGSVVGTPAFMAPEQARGDIVDHRCDLFSLGCVMYRMLTGRLPFQGNTLYAVLSAIASETPPSPATVRPETPQPLSDLVDQLLAKNSDDRPASAQAVLEELVAIELQTKQPQSPQSLLGSQPTSAGHVESPTAEARWDFPVLASASLSSRPRLPKKKARLYSYAAPAVLAAGLTIAGVLALRENVVSPYGSRDDRPSAEIDSDAAPVAKLGMVAKGLRPAQQSAEADRSRLPTQTVKPLEEQVQESMEELTVTSVVDPLHSRSVWTGTHALDGNDYPASMGITGRDGDKFQGILEWHASFSGHAVMLVEGKVTGTDIVFEIKNIQQGKDVVSAKYTGKLEGKLMSGSWTTTNGRHKGAFSYKQMR